MSKDKKPTLPPPPARQHVDSAAQKAAEARKAAGLFDGAEETPPEELDDPWFNVRADDAGKRRHDKPRKG